MTRAQAARDLLSNGEVDVRRVVDPLQGREIRTLAQVLAGVNVGNADAGAKRRANRLAFYGRLDAGDLRQRYVPRGACAVDFFNGNGALLAELHYACELRLCQGRLRL